MINNLVAPVRENKGEGLGSNITGEPSKSVMKSGKEGFGTILQSLQEKGANTNEAKSGLILEGDATSSELSEENTESLQNELKGATSSSEKITIHSQNLVESEKNVNKASGETRTNDQGAGGNTAGLNDSEALLPIQDDKEISVTTDITLTSSEKVILIPDGESPVQTHKEEKNNSGGGEESNKPHATDTNKLVSTEIIASESTPVLDGYDASIEPLIHEKGEDLIQESGYNEIKDQAVKVQELHTTKGVKNPPGEVEQSVVNRQTDGIHKPVGEGQGNTTPIVDSELMAKDSGSQKADTRNVDEKIQPHEKPGLTINTPPDSQVSSRSGIQVTGEQSHIESTKVPKSEKIAGKDSSFYPVDQIKSTESKRTQPEIASTLKIDLRNTPLRQEPIRNIGLSNTDLRVKQGTTTVQFTEESEPVEVHEKLVNDVVVNKTSASVLGNGIVAENIQANQVREKKYGTHISNFEDRNEILGESSRGRKIFEAESLFKLSGLSQAPFKTTGIALSSEMKVSDEEIFWKDYSTNASQVKENKNSDLQMTGFSRLMEIPVYNFSVRRNLFQSLSQAVTKTVSGSQSSSETWQKHNFTLEDGKNFQVSVRQADGIVYLKLNSSMGELNRLLQQHQNEIREYLERECNVKVDLQFDGDQNQDLSQFFGDSGSGKKGFKTFPSSGSTKNFTKTDAETIQKSIRKFGYNRMEWMA